MKTTVVSIIEPWPTDKRCFVYCGPEHCNCMAGARLRHPSFPSIGDAMNKQIAGYTGPTPAEGLVKFLAVFADPHANIIVQVRNEKGDINEITVPRAEARKVAVEILNAMAGDD